MLSDESALAWYGGRDLTIPAVWESPDPGHFRYAVCLEKDADVLQTCSYSPAGSVDRKRLVWRVLVRDTLTGEQVGSRTFEGGDPKTCPRSYTFQGNSRKGTISGSKPDSAQIAQWIGSVLGSAAPAAPAQVERPVAAATPEATVAPQATPTPTPIVRKEPVKLTVVHLLRGDRATAVQRLVGQHMAAHPNVEIEVQAVENDTVLLTMAAAGVKMDVVIGSSSQLVDWQAQGLLAPLADYADEAWMRERYTDFAVDAVTVEGVVYGLPTETQVVAMIYNRDLISEAELPKTTDELIEAARSWIKSEWYFAYPAKTAYWSAGWFHAGDAWFIDQDCRSNLVRPDGIAAAKLISAFSEIMPPGTNYTLADDLFKEGEVAITLNGPWVLPSVEDAGIDYGVAPMPVVSGVGAPAAPYVDHSAWMVSAQAVKDGTAGAAWELIVDLAGPSGQAFMAEEASVVPTLREEADSDPFLQQAAQGTLLLFGPCISRVWGPVGDMLEEIWEGAVPADAVISAQEAIQQAVADLD